MFMVAKIRKDKQLSPLRSTVESTRDGELHTSQNIQRRKEVSTSNSDCMRIENSSLSMDSQTVYSSVWSATPPCISKSESTRTDNQNLSHVLRDGSLMENPRPSSLSTRRHGVSVLPVAEAALLPRVKLLLPDGGNFTSTMDSTSSISRMERP